MKIIYAANAIYVMIFLIAMVTRFLKTKKSNLTIELLLMQRGTHSNLLISIDNN
jgi:hypothetical protein